MLLPALLSICSAPFAQGHGQEHPVAGMRTYVLRSLGIKASFPTEPHPMVVGGQKAAMDYFKSVQGPRSFVVGSMTLPKEVGESGAKGIESFVGGSCDYFASVFKMDVVKRAESNANDMVTASANLRSDREVGSFVVKCKSGRLCIALAVAPKASFSPIEAKEFVSSLAFN